MPGIEAKASRAKFSSENGIRTRNRTKLEKIEELKQEQGIKAGTKEEGSVASKSISSQIVEPEHVTFTPGSIMKVAVQLEFDVFCWVLFIMTLATRLYRLDEPRNIVFDELHYGKYIGMYMKRTFFFDTHPPLGKLLVAAAAYVAGYDGSGIKFEKIGSPFDSSTPLFVLRLVPAVFGSLLVPAVYKLTLQLGLAQWTAAIAGFLVLCDNALLTQSRFILMESIMLLFTVVGVMGTLKVRQYRPRPTSPVRWAWLILATTLLTCAVCVKYVGVFSYILGMWILVRDAWSMVCDRRLRIRFLAVYLSVQALVVALVTFTVYITVFYMHLSILTRAGPHDSVMTSAFQASLEGGLASITKGQPRFVAHGSQITLRHTHGRTCWLHSHAHVYPVKYKDGRGSSHQQQVSCYSFKDVNNWWIVKRPDVDDLVVQQPADHIKNGDVVQLVHGITSRALNSHDVAAPVSPHNQEVSCYIDYNVSMPAQNLWKVVIINQDEVETSSDVWQAIESQVRLVHVGTTQALKFSGRQLPDWGFNQHEVVSDMVHSQLDTVWNVEEHRYTKSEEGKERELELLKAEMIPVDGTSVGFWPKFVELQYKMLFGHQETVQSHMYSSEPAEWPLMGRTIAYWIDNQSNAQIHLLGNIVTWWSGTLAVVMYTSLLILYLLRRRRQCYDITTDEWERFVSVGHVLLLGFLLNYLPYFFMDRTLFLHHYLPALLFKVLLLAALAHHIIFITECQLGLKRISAILKIMLLLCCVAVVWSFRKLSALSYGFAPLTAAELLKLRWRESWHFILHRE